MARAVRSTEPPGGKPIRMVIGRLGYLSWACAPAGLKPAQTSAAAIHVPMRISSSRYGRWRGALDP